MRVAPSIFLLSIVAFSFLSCAGLGLLFLFVGLFSIGNGHIVFGIFALLISTGSLFLIWLLWRSIKDKIQLASLDSSTFKIVKPLIGRRIEVKTHRIKGYSRSIDDKCYGTTIFKRNCLTIYFMDGLHPVEFVQYQANNFTGLAEELGRLKIDFLGDEEIYRDGFGQRTRFPF